MVPPALVACTSRAAAQFAIQGTLAGTVAAHLATITEGVLKAMLIAKLTSNTLVVSAILFLSIGAATVGVVASAQRRAEPTIGPEQFGSGRAADDWSWIDQLKNADEATKERLKRCARSATENFAAIRRMIFDYDLGTENSHFHSTRPARRRAWIAGSLTERSTGETDRCSTTSMVSSRR